MNETQGKGELGTVYVNGCTSQRQLVVCWNLGLQKMGIQLYLGVI
jgi:hypothetical protein